MPGRGYLIADDTVGAEATTNAPAAPAPQDENAVLRALLQRAMVELERLSGGGDRMHASA